MQQCQQTMDIQGAQEARAAAQFEQRQAAAAAQRAQRPCAIAMKRIMENPGATAEDYGRLDDEYPEISQDSQRGWDMMSEPRQRTILRDMAQVYSAIDTGNIDIARGFLEERIEAARNSGREDDAQQAELDLAHDGN